MPGPQSMVRGFPKTTPLLVIVEVPRPAKVRLPDALLDVTPVPNDQLPYTVAALPLVVSVIALVRADISIAPILNEALTVTVPADPVSSNTAVS